MSEMSCYQKVHRLFQQTWQCPQNNTAIIQPSKATDTAAVAGVALSQPTCPTHHDIQSHRLPSISPTIYPIFSIFTDYHNLFLHSSKPSKLAHVHFLPYSVLFTTTKLNLFTKFILGAPVTLGKKKDCLVTIILHPSYCGHLLSLTHTKVPSTTEFLHTYNL